MTTRTFAEELTARGLVFQHTGSSIDAIVGTPRTLYLGVDPTADSLHAGSLLPLMTVRRFRERGFKIVVLIGGATAQIGDPSGKSEERVLMAEETVAANLSRIKAQIKTVLATDEVIFVDNAEWLGRVPALSFLRDVGKHFTVNEMLRKESVRGRIDDPNSSISYTEFSYMLLQAYDFFVLHERYGCDLQIGGSDQWGNMTAGVELIRKKTGVETHAMTIPLLVDPKTGRKFGKSESGPIWLDAEKVSPYAFYQFWLHTDDTLVAQYLRYFTDLSLEDIDALEHATAERPEERAAQEALAYEVTELIHGAERAAEARNVSQALFGGSFGTLSASERELLIRAAPSLALARDRLEAGIPLTDILLDAGIASSKRDARTLIESGAVTCNGARVADTAAHVRGEHLIDGIALVRKGKRDMVLLYAA